MANTGYGKMLKRQRYQEYLERKKRVIERKKIKDVLLSYSLGELSIDKACDEIQKVTAK